MNKHKAEKRRPSGDLRAAIVVGDRLVRIGPRLWAVGPIAVSNPQWRAVLNILESAMAAVIIYFALSATNLAIDYADRRLGGIGDRLGAQIVRWLMVDGGLWSSVVWVGVATVSSVRLAALTTWRLFAPASKRKGEASEP